MPIGRLPARSPTRVALCFITAVAMAGTVICVSRRSIGCKHRFWVIEANPYRSWRQAA